MLYNNFQNEKLSALGFGAMRLPLLEDGCIDQAELDRMVDAAIAAGVNYFDTAHPYHGGKSEGALCKSLRQMSRLDKLMSSHKSWEEICRERAEAAKKGKLQIESF
jgi:predicted aldo/keto reductase-like oxidoreductase